MLLIILFYFRCHVAEEYLVERRDWFGVNVNLLPHFDLSMYAKPISFLVVITNVYGIIFYQVYILPCLNKLWWCCTWLLDHINSFINVCKSMLWLNLWRFTGVSQVKISFPIVFVSCSEGSCIWCPSRKRSFQIRNWNFRDIFGYIKRFHQCVFWWYQESLVNWFLSNTFWQWIWMCPENRNEQTIGDSLWEYKVIWIQNKGDLNSV